MFNLPTKEFFNNFRRSIRLLKEEGSCKKCVYNIVIRFQRSKADDDEFKAKTDFDKIEKNLTDYDSGISKYNSGEGDLSIHNNKWKPEIAWLTKALEPALQLYKWVIPTGNGIVNKLPPTDRSLAEIFASIQRSKLGIQNWSLSDLTIGLYLIYLQQASTGATEDVKGDLMSSEAIVQDLIYHIELAKGAYKDSAAVLARHSMLRENNIVKFVKNSSVLRLCKFIHFNIEAYFYVKYIGYWKGPHNSSFVEFVIVLSNHSDVSGVVQLVSPFDDWCSYRIDMRKKLVILGVRGTHTVYDFITVTSFLPATKKSHLKVIQLTLAQQRLLVGFLLMR